MKILPQELADLIANRLDGLLSERVGLINMLYMDYMDEYVETGTMNDAKLKEKYEELFTFTDEEIKALFVDVCTPVIEETKKEEAAIIKYAGKDKREYSLSFLNVYLNNWRIELDNKVTEMFPTVLARAKELARNYVETINSLIEEAAND